MQIKPVAPFLSVSPQLGVNDVGIAAAQGFKTIINNRPDGEGEEQPRSEEIAAAAARHGLQYRHIPVVSGELTDRNVDAFREAMAEVQGLVLAFCRTGTRSISLWALSEAHHLDSAAILKAAAAAGYDLSALEPRLQIGAQAAAPIAEGEAGKIGAPQASKTFDVLIVGGGCAGIATAASLLWRREGLSLAIVEPRGEHYYQPAWTLVGGGVFEREKTQRAMDSVIPKGAQRINAAVAAFEPDHSQVILEDGERLGYRVLIAAPGIKLDWDGVEGLRDTLGKNGVTSNYLFDMAPYTWKLVQGLRHGEAIFTQPPMPIKCAGAPQKAMYLACDHWRREGRLKDIHVGFYNAGGVLFGVKDYVPALMRYVERYGIDLAFNHNLVAVDGGAKTAWFSKKSEAGEERIQRQFDMIHVVPPQCAPDFVRSSPLADRAGWIAVSSETLQHQRFGNVFGLGDACSAPNAKTAAAVRKQAPTVAVNALAVLDGEAPRAIYEGYGSCPLTVERGKIVLAEFGYGGVLQPTFPRWLLDGRKPTRLAWLLKEKLLPWIYWELLLKGKEWFAAPKLLPHTPIGQEARASLDYAADKAKVG